MYAGTLNQLHDTGYEYVGAVANCVNLDFLTLNVLVNQYGLILVDLNCGVQVGAQLLLVCNDLHCSAAQHEGGAN